MFSILYENPENNKIRKDYKKINRVVLQQKYQTSLLNFHLKSVANNTEIALFSSKLPSPKV